MELFRAMVEDEYEEIVFCQDKQTRLKAIIAIHDTTLGPALGGARMWNYASEDAALEDAMRLAKGMTYKHAVSSLNFGGGKSVLIGDPNKDKNEGMLRAFGRYIQDLNGRYITAEDVGTTVEDMDVIQGETKYVTGKSGPGSSGNPSPATAFGVYHGMKAAAKEALGSDSLAGKTVAVQGVGNVALHLCKYLHEEGAQLIVTDINKEAVSKAVEQFGAKAVEPDDIYGVRCDIFAPCAMGAVINDETIVRMQAKIIAGSANNQLKEARHGELIHELGIVYAPDYVINAGGVINIAEEWNGYDRERAFAKVMEINRTVSLVFEISKQEGIPSYLAADRLAEERIRASRVQVQQ
jgi:leucine dehydrogenase